MSSSPFATVVINTYNRADLVGRAIQSVVDQTLVPEIIVVDDGSSDDTAAVVQSFVERGVRYLFQENSGLSAARNAGAANAKGDWLLFLDDDDWAEPAWVERLVAAGTGAGVVCCGYRYVSEDGARVWSPSLPRPLGRAFDDVRGVFLAGTFAVGRAVFDAVGGYAPEMTGSHQTELALRLVPWCRSRGLSITTVDEPLVNISRRVATDRPMSSPQALLIASDYVVAHHRDRLARDPRVLASYLSVAGVSAVRLRDFRRGRHAFAAAARVEPRSLKRWLRLLVSLVPPLARHVWGTASAWEPDPLASIRSSDRGHGDRRRASRTPRAR